MITASQWKALEAAGVDLPPYEDLLRPFSVTPEVPYTDVWTFATVAGYPGKHVCEKPQGLLQHVIQASSRAGGVVLDSFAGSGSCGRAALTLGREFIGIELDSGWCEVARAACAKPHASRVLRPAVDPMQCDLF